MFLRFRHHSRCSSVAQECLGLARAGLNACVVRSEFPKSWTITARRDGEMSRKRRSIVIGMAAFIRVREDGVGAHALDRLEHATGNFA